MFFSCLYFFCDSSGSLLRVWFLFELMNDFALSYFSLTYTSLCAVTFSCLLKPSLSLSLIPYPRPYSYNEKQPLLSHLITPFPIPSNSTNPFSTLYSNRNLHYNRSFTNILPAQDFRISPATSPS